MLSLLPVFVILSLVIYIIVYVFERESARAQADEFIAGIREPTPKALNKCMMKLQTANSRLLDRNETDRRRVELLRSLRDNTVTSHP
ncbi:hypothetical protein ES708_18242 [subsurface metagenome]